MENVRYIGNNQYNKCTLLLSENKILHNLMTADDTDIEHRSKIHIRSYNQFHSNEPIPIDFFYRTKKTTTKKKEITSQI